MRHAEGITAGEAVAVGSSKPSAGCSAGDTRASRAGDGRVVATSGGVLSKGAVVTTAGGSGVMVRSMSIVMDSKDEVMMGMREK